MSLSESDKTSDTKRLDQVQVDRINRQLKDKYGIDTITGLPIWRIVWADEQREKQKDTFEDHSPSGLYLRTITEVREIQKYPHVREKHILERLVPVPDFQRDQLVGAKLSYELIFVFWNNKEEYLPPKFEVAEFVIETIYAAQFGTGNLHKYVDKENSQEASLEQKRKRVDEIVEYLWGDSSSLGGETINESGSAIIVPSNFQGVR